ncbi:ABC transporter permease [Streptomyces sp. NBC_00459]|uniref:ABC transporter permease n=1 Tax=Streptomyces sp. NBC_00459 TaxID=2975749 RepID=UPI002E198D4D
MSLQTPPPSAWHRFRDSPYLPASVLVLIVSAAAALFAGAYSYSSANPVPHRVPIAVVGSSAQDTAFVQELDRRMGTTLDARSYDTTAAARHAIDEQHAFAVLDAGRGSATLDVASASGVSIARLFDEAAPTAAESLGHPVTVTDLKPMQDSDPQGLALFYTSLAAVIIGFLGSVQLGIHARGLKPAERLAFTAAYCLLGGLLIHLAVDPLLGSLDMPFPGSWLVLALTMFTGAMVFTAFSSLLGRWAMLPTWGLLLLLGNPNSGGTVAWPLLPPFLAFIGRWLPPGASVSAQRDTIYFPGHQHAEPILVLAAWSIAGLLTYVLRERRPV